MMMIEINLRLLFNSKTSKNMVKMYKKLWNSIKYLVCLKCNNINNHTTNEPIKVKVNSDEDLPIIKNLKKIKNILKRL